MLRRYFFSAVFLVGLAAGCGKTVSLGPYITGTDGGTSATGGGPDSCAGKACGTPCPLPDQPDFGYCSADGACSPTYLCAPYQPCLGKVCGDPCGPCDPRTDAPCPLPDGEIFSCDPNGACVPGAIACPPCKSGDPYCPYDPCAALPCGTPCNPCDPADPNCVPTGASYCSQGICAPEEAAYCDPCSDPATGLPFQCGQPCDACLAKPWDPSCPPSVFLNVCDGFGACNLPDYAKCSPTYEPCAGKQCGDLCTVCDTLADPNCYPKQFLFCNGDGPGATCSEFVSCPVLDCALLGLQCGTQCQTCAANSYGTCDPMFCDANYNCTTADSVQCGTYAPCASATCGDPCTLCDSSPCTEDTFLVCDGGTCTDLPSCYAPCAGKSYCAPCTICDPADLGCMEPDPQRKFCDSQGQCNVAMMCP